MYDIVYVLHTTCIAYHRYYILYVRHSMCITYYMYYILYVRHCMCTTYYMYYILYHIYMCVYYIRYIYILYIFFKMQEQTHTWSCFELPNEVFPTQRASSTVIIYPRRTINYLTRAIAIITGRLLVFMKVIIVNALHPHRMNMCRNTIFPSFTRLDALLRGWI